MFDILFAHDFCVFDAIGAVSALNAVSAVGAIDAIDAIWVSNFAAAFIASHSIHFL